MVDLQTFEVIGTPSIEEGVRYLKTIYKDNFPRFKARFLDPMEQYISMHGVRKPKVIVDLYIQLFNELTPYTYLEAFQKDTNFSSMIFSVINIPDMIKELGHTRIRTEGIRLVNKVYNPITNSFTEKTFEQVYELHSVNLSKLKIEGLAYAIKCWCTSTDTEHWLWVDQFYESPLEAIASTCKVYEKMKPNIKHIIRQGDVFLFEMTEEVEISESDPVVSLTRDEYFGLLKSQS